MTPKISTKGRILYCRKCDGHGKLSILKSHNTNCPYLFCECKNCQKLDKKRRNSFQKRNYRQIEAAEKLTKLRQDILHLRADLKDDPDAEVLIAELQKQKISFPVKYDVNGNNSSREIFHNRRRCQSCDTITPIKMINKCDTKSDNDNLKINNNDQLICHRATSSSPYSSSPIGLPSVDLNSSASSPRSKKSSSAAPFDLWLEKEYQRRQQKKAMEAMRIYTSTAQTTASSPIVTSTYATAINTIATNPLLSHALNTAGITNQKKIINNQPTTSMGLENMYARKRPAEDEIIQIDDDQPTPRRHCSNNDIQNPMTFNKLLTAPITSTTNITVPLTVSTPSTLPPRSNFATPKPPPSISSESVSIDVEGHRYVTLPTIPPISILVPHETKIIDTLDEIININQPNINNSSTLQLNGQPNSVLQDRSVGHIPTTNSISTSIPSQLLLEGLRQQKPNDSQSFSNAFLSAQSLTQSQLNSMSTNPLIHPMIQQNISSNNISNNLDHNQLLNVVTQPQWIQLIQQPQYNPPQKNNLLHQQIQTPQKFPTSFPPLQSNLPFQNQPFPPTITNQPQLRFPTQTLPPTSNSGLSAILSQNNISNIPKSINSNQPNSTSTSSLQTKTTSNGMQILSQPQQNNVENASNLSCNNLINFANFTLPTFTPPQPPLILQSQFQQENEKEKLQNETIESKEQENMTAAEKKNVELQGITSMRLFQQIHHQQHNISVTDPSANQQQIQLPSVSQSTMQISSSQSHSPVLNSIAKLNIPIDQQQFAQYLLNLPSISPSGSVINATPQLPSLGQSPSDDPTENECTTTKTKVTPEFTPNHPEHLYTSTMLSQFHISNLKQSSTDEIASSFIDGDESMDECNVEDKSYMTAGSNVNHTYLATLQSGMVVLSTNGTA